MSIFIEIHAIQTVPPSNINRDDTGAPKTAPYGGVRRAMVSSQAWKAVMRREFGSSAGIRTRALVDLISISVSEMNPELTCTARELAAAFIVTSGLLGKEADKKKLAALIETGQGDTMQFISAGQIDAAAQMIVGKAAGTAYTAKEARQALIQNTAPDMGMFGRMFAAVRDLDTDASVQIAPALSVHEVENESDYFTAVEDLRVTGADDSGAGMLGTTEFNSSTLYRYGNIDVTRFTAEMGRNSAESPEQIRAYIETFLRAFALTMPTGKQNSFANRTLPEAILLVVRDTHPENLIGAFVDPVPLNTGETISSIVGRRLADELVGTEQFLPAPLASFVVRVRDEYLPLEEAGATRLRLPEAVAAAVDAAYSAS